MITIALAAAALAMTQADLSERAAMDYAVEDAVLTAVYHSLERTPELALRLNVRGLPSGTPIAPRSTRQRAGARCTAWRKRCARCRADPERIN